MPLYSYGELAAEEEERLEEHVGGCTSCADEFAKHRRMLAVFDGRAEIAAPDLLAACRQELGRAIRQPIPAPVSTPAAWRLIGAGISALLAPLVRWRQPLGAFALIALGFFSARLLPTTPAPVAAEPLIANIRSVQQDSSGHVQIAFDEVRRRVLSGRLEDSRVQHLLKAALRQDANPGVRVETMSVLKNRPVPDGIRELLLYALQNDTNPGVRLKAVESLRPYAAEDAVRQALARVLIKDDNPGVRVQAIDLLVQHSDDSMVGVLQELVEREHNQYIRMRMTKALEDMNASVGTF